MSKQTEALKLALNKAFQLGQRYWSWADSEYSSHWKKADAAKAEFDQLVQDTINAALAEQPAKEKAPQSANCEAPGWISSDHARGNDCTTEQPYPDNFIDALKYDVAKRDSEAQQAYKDAFVNGTGVMLGDKRIDPASIYKQPEQEPVACRYGDNGYACCEGGPCAAEEHNDKTDWQERGMVAEAALAKLLDEKDEPVAWATQLNEYAHIKWGAKRPDYPIRYEVPLYTSPPAQRKPLTDEEIESINVRLAGNRDLARLFARAIEAAHNIKGEA